MFASLDPAPVIQQRASDVVVDITGHIPADVASVSTDTPKRFADTPPEGSTVDGDASGAGPVGAGTVIEIPIAGRGSVPGDTATVAANVTITAAEQAGLATVYGCGTQPPTSTINFQPGQSIANTTIAPLSSRGSLCVYLHRTADVVVDITASTR